MASLDIRVLGPLRVLRGSEDVALPKSRKVRVLLAVLALEPRGILRSRLCDLLWDVPNDPRGELRWSLSKLRGIVDDAAHPRVVTDGERISLDVRDCSVDALDLDRLVTAGLANAPTEQLTELADRIAGGFLEGTTVDGTELTAWLEAQRQRFRAHTVALLRAIAEREPSAVPQNARLPIVATAAPAEAPPRARHGSIVVMPFAAATSDATDAAHGLTDDIITGLAKLRALFVIARGTSYTLRERGVDAREAGRILGVEYAVSGVVRRSGASLFVIVELVETASGVIVWTDEVEVSGNDALAAIDPIVGRVVATIAEEIERAEGKRAILKPPSSLDAWEAYHRGLWHMYRFTGPDNETARRFFRTALDLDPAFARAYAGLSFTHFQNVFLELTPDRDEQLSLALDTANRSLGADDRDPAAHWAMGRALWLNGNQGESVAALEQSVALSPSFALGHYTLGFVLSQTGDPQSAVRAVDYSRELSPFDPLQFGMLSSRALALTRLGERDAAADWSVKATNRPNAHVHILAIAAMNLVLASRHEQARNLVARIRTNVSSYTVENLLRAFRFAPDLTQLFRTAARQINFD